jgi:hypothetical protein
MTINAVYHLPPATPPPAEHEKSLAPPISGSGKLKGLHDLSRQLSESPHENGYLRYSKERGWKFSPNMSLRDTLHIRDAGYSDAPINPAATKPVTLAKPGEKIALTTLNSRSQALIKPPPRTVFFKASELNAPIPALQSSLPEISQPPVAAPRQRASAPADLATPSVNALRKTFEAMGRA